MARKSAKAIVKEEPSLERDLNSNAILNKDSRSYHLARSRKKVLKAKNAAIEDLADRLSALEKIVQGLNK